MASIARLRALPPSKALPTRSSVATGTHHHHRQCRRALATASAAPANHTPYTPPPFHNGPQPFYHGEPVAPSVRTEFPGPRAREMIKELDEVFDTRALNTLVDYERSVGNYMCDADGNLFLDV